MPTLKLFDDFKVYMGLREHQPPHVHVRFNDGNECDFNISDCAIRHGQIRGKHKREIEEWIARNKTELMYMWETRDFRNKDNLV